VTPVLHEGICGGPVVFDRPARESSRDAAEQRLHRTVVPGVVLHDDVAQPRVVLVVRGLPWLALAQCRILVGHRSEPLHDEAELDRHRLLAPERAIVVEDGDAFLGRGVAVPLARRGLHEFDHRPPRRRVRPGGQRVGGRTGWTSAVVGSRHARTVKIPGSRPRASLRPLSAGRDRRIARKRFPRTHERWSCGSPAALGNLPHPTPDSTRDAPRRGAGPSRPPSPRLPREERLQRELPRSRAGTRPRNPPARRAQAESFHRGRLQARAAPIAEFRDTA
jgi:hypothetical protein